MSLFDVLNEAALFSFPKDAHSTLPTLNSEECEYLFESFFLPYQVTAVEDPAGCIILFDLHKEQTGAGTRRFFVNIEMTKNRGSYEDSSQHPRAEDDDPNLITMQFGECQCRQVGPGGTEAIIEMVGGITYSSMYNVEEKQFIPTPPNIFPPGEWQGMVNACLYNVRVAYLELMYFNAPHRWILETSPAKQKPEKKKKKKVTRSQERPIYIFATQKELQEEYGLGQSDKKKKASHWRRRHQRTFNSDRYVNKKGMTITIPAKWIGDSEVIKGKKLYKVMLDW